MSFSAGLKDEEICLNCWSLMHIEYHFYGNTTDLYTKILERTLALLW
jgi:hypothetical protein